MQASHLTSLPPAGNRSLDRRVRLATCLVLPCLLVLSACSGNGTPVSGQNDDNASALPGPEAGKGSITGMPDKPGPGPVGDAVTADDTQPTSMADASGFDLATDGSDATIPTDGTLAAPGDGMPMAAGEPTVQDALAVLRDYYAAIAARQFDAAYALWSDHGSASGQTAQQFANGFADTGQVRAMLGEAGRVDAAAGSRFIQVPLSITATHLDGSEHHYAGSYTLRRTVVDGAGPEQHAWRIASADIREVKP